MHPFFYDKTRYLLNFAGLRSSSYYVGILFADFLIFSISNVLLVISVFVLQLDTIKANAGWLFLVMQFFGLPYISLSYNLGYFFNNPETGFKFSILLSLLTYAVPLVLT